MGTLTIQNPGDSGLDLALTAAAAAGDEFVNNGRDNLLIVSNGSGGAVTVTVTAQTTSAQVRGLGTVTKSDTALSVAAGGIAAIGPFSDAFNDVDGKVQVTYSSETSVEVAVVKVRSAL